MNCDKSNELSFTFVMILLLTMDMIVSIKIYNTYGVLMTMMFDLLVVSVIFTHVNLFKNKEKDNTIEMIDVEENLHED
jgi:hypothetical protein